MSLYKVYTTGDHYSIEVEADEVKTNNNFIMFSLNGKIMSCMSLAVFAYYETVERPEPHQWLPVTASSQLTHIEDPYEAAKAIKDSQ